MTNLPITFTGNTDNKMTGLVTVKEGQKVTLCGEYNGEGFNLEIDITTGEIELFV